MLLNRPRANEIMRREGLGGLIATTHENVTYLTDHHGDFWFIRATKVAAVLAEGDSKAILVAPASHVTTITPLDEIDLVVFAGIPLVVAENGTPNEDDKKLLGRRSKLESEAGFMEGLFAALRQLGLSEARVAVDERNFTREQFAALEAEFPKADFVNGYEIFRAVRAVKSPAEVERLRSSVHATEAGIRKALSILTDGVTENELELAFNTGVAQAGAIPLFAVICSGQRSAHTNTVPSGRKISTGEVVRFDVGSRFQFYPSDIARTFVVGEPTETQRLYWDAIVEGQKAAMDVMRPGVTAGEVFKAAVETTRAAGLPNFKRQHVGHGIGIDLYDMPILTPENETPLEEGMVFCVETPSYEVGYAGFQVEDTMVVQENDVELLSTFPRDLTYR